MAIQKTCAVRKDCKIVASQNSYGVRVYRVEYTDGFWFQIATDPGVVELQLAPMTLDQAKRWKKHLQQDIFELSKKVGLSHARSHDLGGHLHIGADSVFAKEPVLFRNFMVDYMNRPELAQGYFGRDSANAPHIIELRKRDRLELQKVIDEFDQAETPWDARRLASEVQCRVYTYCPSGPDWDPVEKYQAFNVTKMVDDETPKPARTVELRAQRGVRDVEEYMFRLEVWHQRLAFLRGKKGRIPLDLDPKMNQAAVMSRLVGWFSESGVGLEEARKHNFELSLKGFAQAHAQGTVFLPRRVDVGCLSRSTRSAAKRSLNGLLLDRPTSSSHASTQASP